jgi:hypothetical protein
MLKTFAAALLVCLTAVAQAQEAKPAAPSPFTFALHGFVSMSGYMQDQRTGFNEGQRALYAVPPDLTKDQTSLGFDLRQSRFNFSVKGPQVFGGATPSAVLEIDFMQGFGEGNFGNVSLMNRMRLAYSELNWGNHRIAIGQLNDLTFAMAPASLSHIAFPLGYGTGNIGWRRPGFWGFHNFAASPDMKVEFAWEVGRSQWADAATATGGQTYNAPNDASLGEASTLPAVQARLTLTSGKLFNIWVAGHWNRVDMNGVGTTGGVNDFDVTAGAAGAKLTPGPLTLAAAGFYGQNTGGLLGNIVQFQPGGATATTPAAASVKDVTAWGIWGQAGYNLTKEFSLWGLYGVQKPDEADAKAAGFTRLKNETINVQANYRDGGYAIGAEWTYFKTKTATYTGGAFASDTNLKANQYMVTGNYFF